MTNSIVRNAFVYTSYDGDSESTGWVVTDADIELCRHWCDAFDYDMVVFFTGGEWTYTDSEPERKTRGQLHRDIQALYADMRKRRKQRGGDSIRDILRRRLEEQFLLGFIKAPVPEGGYKFEGLASSITKEPVEVDLSSFDKNGHIDFDPPIPLKPSDTLRVAWSEREPSKLPLYHYSLDAKYGPVDDIGHNGGLSTAIASARAMEVLHNMGRSEQESEPYILPHVPDAYYQGREIPIQGDTTDFVSINVRLMTEEEYDAIRAHHVVFPGQHDPWGTSWGVTAIDDEIPNHPHITDENGDTEFLGWNGEKVIYRPNVGSGDDE